jgi:serine phosphatase RsbU (regulator of sigma subunit)
LGDVTGKGPAAALAVAAIVSLLRKKDFEPTPLDSTIKELNIHIFNLFRGNIGSAVCAAQMDDNGIMSIAVHGMAGWVHVSKAGAKLIPARGHSLGTLDHIDVQLTTFQLDVGDFIFAFSDGCIEGTRPIARLIRHLTTNQNPHITADELFKTINEIGKDSVHADDKAMIYVRRIA